MYCKKCKKMFDDSNYEYCIYCGSHLIGNKEYISEKESDYFNSIIKGDYTNCTPSEIEKKIEETNTMKVNNELSQDKYEMIIDFLNDRKTESFNRKGKTKGKIGGRKIAFYLLLFATCVIVLTGLAEGDFALILPGFTVYGVPMILVTRPVRNFIVKHFKVKESVGVEVAYILITMFVATFIATIAVVI